MPLAVKEGYVNPLTMIDKSRMPNIRQAGSHRSEGAAAGISGKKLKELDLQKTMIQNEILLTKNSTQTGEVSRERTEHLEEKLEDISREERVTKDTYIREEIQESPSIYNPVKDGKGGFMWYFASHDER